MFQRFCWMAEKCCAVPYFNFHLTLFFFFHSLMLWSSSSSNIYNEKKAQKSSPFPLSTRCFCGCTFYFHIFMLTYSSLSLSHSFSLTYTLLYSLCQVLRIWWKGTWEIWITKLLRKAWQKTLWMNRGGLGERSKKIIKDKFLSKIFIIFSKKLFKVIQWVEEGRELRQEIKRREQRKWEKLNFRLLLLLVPQRRCSLIY